MHEPVAAYGLTFPDLVGGREFLRPPRGGETPWRITREVTDRPAALAGVREDEITDRYAVHPLGDGGVARIDRATRTTHLTTASPVADREVVHPHLASTAVVTAVWRGLPALHAGAVSLGDDVFVLLGERAAGKSTAVWSLLQQGFAHVSDDVVLVAGDAVLPGPRCVDLRAPVARCLGVGEDLGVVGRRERWRANVVGEPSATLRLAGFVHLDWTTAQRSEFDDLAFAQRLHGVEAALAARVPQHDPAALLRLAALPALRWSRPRDLHRVHDSAAELASALRG
ncbi:hypothetical protein AB2L28_03200 [Kineococcus sp. TBRC 1896]|uniref:Hpr(Ser) kinase/phosphatase n=1 Tax=Kineococcus mangrovi TaxID=1660183 RepID=A0ABV4HXU0_9ACTN